MADALAGARRDYDRLQELSRLLRIVRAAAPGAAQVNAIGAISPDVASQIKALDVLIAGQANAAVRAQLRTIRDEFIDRTIADASEGAARAIDGFQEGEDSLRRLGATPNDEVLYNAGFELNLSRRLRNGAELHAVLQWPRRRRQLQGQAARRRRRRQGPRGSSTRSAPG